MNLESNQQFFFTGKNFRNDSSEDFLLIVSFNSEIKISDLAVEYLAA